MVSLLEELELSARYLSLLPGESAISYKGGLLILDDKGFIYSFTNLENQTNHSITELVEKSDDEKKE